MSEQCVELHEGINVIVNNDPDEVLIVMWRGEEVMTPVVLPHLAILKVECGRGDE